MLLPKAKKKHEWEYLDPCPSVCCTTTFSIVRIHKIRLVKKEIDWPGYWQNFWPWCRVYSVSRFSRWSLLSAVSRQKGQSLDWNCAAYKIVRCERKKNRSSLPQSCLIQTRVVRARSSRRTSTGRRSHRCRPVKRTCTCKYPRKSIRCTAKSRYDVSAKYSFGEIPSAHSRR